MKHQTVEEFFMRNDTLCLRGNHNETPDLMGETNQTGESFETNRPELIPIGQSDETASKLHQTRLPAERFKYRGKNWRIFKRKADADASWYLYFEFNKERNLLSLGSSSKQHALAEAKLKIDLHYADREKGLRSSMVRSEQKKFSPLTDIIGKADTDNFGVLLTVPTKKMAGERSRKAYGWSLRWVLRLALDLHNEQVDALDSSVLSKATARKFFDAVARNSVNFPEQSERNKYVRTAHSFFNNACALLAPRPLEAMRSTFNLHLPDVADFRKGNQIYGQAVPPPNRSVLPSDAVINKTLREWIRIAETPGYQIPGGDRQRIKGTAGHELPLAPLNELDRRNLFVSVGIELSCGFRVSETKRIRRNWITAQKGMPLVQDLNTKAKDGTGKIEVAPLDPFWSVLWFWIRKNNWDVGAEDLLLIARDGEWGEMTDRKFWPETHASHWLRWLGWQTQKTNHALRDFSASMITMRYGLGEACDWCRHKTLATTERNYSRFVKLSKRVDAKKLAWIRWAK
jgi:hypothetical protein